jgi:small subunit ribosomal protein S1
VGGVSRGPELVPGMTVEGVVEKVEPFGVFVQLTGTKGRAGRGLVPNAELGLPRGADVRKEMPVGKHVTAKVLQTGDKLRLSVQALRDDAERADFEGYREQAKQTGGMGTLGDLLKKKLTE